CLLRLFPTRRSSDLLLQHAEQCLGALSLAARRMRVPRGIGFARESGPDRRRNRGGLIKPCRAAPSVGCLLKARHRARSHEHVDVFANRVCVLAEPACQLLDADGSVILAYKQQYPMRRVRQTVGLPRIKSIRDRTALHNSSLLTDGTCQWGFGSMTVRLENGSTVQQPVRLTAPSPGSSYTDDPRGRRDVRGRERRCSQGA